MEVTRQRAPAPAVKDPLGPRVFVTQPMAKKERVLLADGSYKKNENGSLYREWKYESLAPAEAFGEVIVMFEPGLSAYALGQIVPRLHEYLRDFNPDRDYMLMLGDPQIMCAAAAILGRRFRKFRLLKWDRPPFLIGDDGKPVKRLSSEGKYEYVKDGDGKYYECLVEI